MLTKFCVTRKRRMESRNEKAITRMMTRPCCQGWVKKLLFNCWIRETTAPPGAKAREKAHEGAEGLCSPDINRSLAWEHQTKLPGDNRTRNKEGNKPKNPVDICRWPGPRGHYTSITDKKNDCNKNSYHIERVEYFGQNTTRDTL